MSKGEEKTRAWSNKRLKAIELLAQGGMTHSEVAEAIGISPRTLSTWKTKPDFVDAIINRSRELIRAELPSIYSQLKKKSISGSHQHIKILFDHLDKLEEMQSKVSSNQITITWESNEPQD